MNQTNSPLLHSKKLSRRTLIKRGAIGATALALGQFVVDKEWIEVTRTKVQVPRWYGSGLRAAVISDVHLNGQDDVDRALRAVELAADEYPDVLLLPGDFISGSGTDFILLLRQFLAGIKPYKIPSFASMGNHDANTGQPYWIIKEFNDSMTTMLINDFIEFKEVVIAGLDDAIWGRPQPEALFGGGFRPYPKDKPTILMCHEPDYAAELDFGIALVVSGHTHGGQVCMPFGLPFHLPKLGKNFVSGWYPDEKTPMYVTRGIGMVGLPMRAFCRPEVAILDISGI